VEEKGRQDMTNIKRWALAFGIAAAGLLGGASAVTAATAEDAALGLGQEIASHEDSDGSGDEVGQDEKGDKGGKDDDRKSDGGSSSGGDSSDEGDADGSDAGDTDGPGDDEDD
jgi:hypothetical protein